jgi:stage III sporulation protein AE
MKKYIRTNLKRRYKILILVIYTLSISNFVCGVDEKRTSSSQEAVDIVDDSYNLSSYVNTINEYVQDTGIEGISLNSISKDLISNGSIDYKSIFSKLASLFFKEIFVALKGAITIYIIIVVMAIINNVQLEKDSDVSKIANLVCFFTLSTITIATFSDTIISFKNIVGTLTTIMQVVSPFLMAILIGTGAITTTGIIQPLLLFLASLVGFIINYIVVPFFSISVAFNVISSISENLRLEKISKLFTSSALWITSIVLTVFLGILSFETSISSSVDSLAVKTTQTAVSNFVPVVGKFFSDSFETVVGATKIISKVGGTVGIIGIILVAIVPIVKISSIMIIYTLLGALIQPIYKDDNLEKYISSFAKVYKNLLGILIGIVILFIISTAIIINLSSSIIT